MVPGMLLASSSRKLRVCCTPTLKCRGTLFPPLHSQFTISPSTQSTLVPEFPLDSLPGQTRLLFPLLLLLCGKALANIGKAVFCSVIIHSSPFSPSLPLDLGNTAQRALFSPFPMFAWRARPKGRTWSATARYKADGNSHALTRTRAS